MLSTSPRPLRSSTQHPETKGEAARCSPLSGPQTLGPPSGLPRLAPGARGCGRPPQTRPRVGRAGHCRPDWLHPPRGPAGLPVPLCHQPGLRSPEAEQGRPRGPAGLARGVRGPGRRQRPLGHAGPQLLSPSVTTFFREMALREAACLRVWPLFLPPSGKSHSFPVWPLGLPQGSFELQALCQLYVLALREPQPLTIPWGPPCGALARTISPGRRTEAVFPSARRWSPRREGTFTRLLRLPVTERK